MCVLYTPLDTKLSLSRECIISLVRYIFFSQSDWTILYPCYFYLFTSQAKKRRIEMLSLLRMGTQESL